MVKLYLTILGGVVGYVALNVLVFWISAKSKEVQRKKYKNIKGKETSKITQGNNGINYDAVIANNNEKSFYYNYAKDKFKELLKGKRLTREQILYLKQLINSCIPKEHMAIYKINYKNDCHEIYCKLKSSFISEEDFKRIIGFLTMIEES